MRTLVMAAVAFATVVAYGQVQSVQPPNPSNNDDNIVIRVAVYLHGLYPLPARVEGSDIHLVFRGNSVLQYGGYHNVAIGRLEAGTYAVHVRFEYTDNNGQVYHVVNLPAVPLLVYQAHAVPALSVTSLITLSVAMAFAGALAIKR